MSELEKVIGKVALLAIEMASKMLALSAFERMVTKVTP